MQSEVTGGADASTRHLSRLEQKDPIGWLAIGALTRLSELRDGDVLACVGSGRGYFGKIAAERSGASVRSMAAFREFIDPDCDESSRRLESSRDMVLQAVVEMPRPAAVVLRDIEIGVKLVDSLLAIARKKSGSSSFDDGKKG